MSTDEKIIKNKVRLLKLSEMLEVELLVLCLNHHPPALRCVNSSV
jgi:hypothetical protein